MKTRRGNFWYASLLSGHGLYALYAENFVIMLMELMAFLLARYPAKHGFSRCAEHALKMKVMAGRFTLEFKAIIHYNVGRVRAALDEYEYDVNMPEGNQCYVDGMILRDVDDGIAL